MHQTVGNVLETLVHANPLEHIIHARNFVEDALATAMHAICSQDLGYSCPSFLAFSWDMLLMMPLVDHW